MATSPNYGWLEPDNTDLVKNGALAIRTLGNAIDTTMATMVPKSIVDAKGDLIAGTAADTAARLAVGNNGETLVADSSTSTGLRYQGSQVAGKNLLVNGNFDIWQRGTSFVNPAGYFADRFTTLGSISNITFSQQTTGAPAGSRYILRATATGASAYSTVCQMIETAQVEMLQGSTATYSVKLRVNSTFNATGLILKLQKSATADAGTGATWTDISTTSIALASLPTTAGTSTATYYQGTITGAIPSDGTANSLRVIVDFNGGSASGSIVEYSQFMLELGSVPTTFMRAGGTIQGELDACMRYFQRFGGDNAFQVFGIGQAVAAGQTFVNISYLTQMRTVPVGAYSAGNTFASVTANFGARVGFTSIATDYATKSNATVTLSGASSLVAGNASMVCANNTTTATMDFSAEL
jgi:hypothetical protein